MLNQKMDKKTYLKQFSRLVRWRLPAEEAEDVISDYKELLSIQPEDGQELVKKLGTPFAAVQQLKTAKEYKCWLVVFSALTLCSAFFFCGLFTGGDFGWRYSQAFNTAIFYLFIGLAAFWKWKSPRGKGKCPGLLSVMLGLLGTAAVLAALIAFWLIPIIQYLKGDVPFISGDWVAPLFAAVLRLDSGLAFILGITGLINSRLRDRRWLSVSTMAVTVLFIAMNMVLLMTSLSDPDAVCPAVMRLIPPAVIGILGVIWSLC